MTEPKPPQIMDVGEVLRDKVMEERDAWIAWYVFGTKF